MKIEELFAKWRLKEDRFFVIENTYTENNQELTNDAFSEKWVQFSKEDLSDQNKLQDFQRDWFLQLYGFESEEQFGGWLQNFPVILDAGCGLGYKTYWFASLAPDSAIIAIDYSEAARVAYENSKDKYDNIFFAQGDIANTRLPAHSVDLVICDQVIMHTEDPSKTLSELARITARHGEIFCYWYRRKALPRELLDEYFRVNNKSFSKEDLWKLSEEVLELGKKLSEMNITAEFPNLPSLGIKGGRMDLQRFIYWNFIKCFWNGDLGYQTSLSTNFDWYAPANARRFSKQEVMEDLGNIGFAPSYFHEETACYSGRFKRN